MDWFSKVLGVGMIVMTLYVVLQTRPDVVAAARGAVMPAQMDPKVIVTLVGGTIGGYIMFSGAHRLIDGGIGGPENAGLITWASIQGILIAGVMRVVVFLAVLGVVAAGGAIGQKMPVFDAFRSGAGDVGYVLACLVFWAAAITSVVGCAYTSISFVKPNPDDPGRPRLLVGFILASLAATLLALETGWEPTPLLIAAGTVNGVLLPVILGAILIAAHQPRLMGEYRHPWWATVCGVLAWLGTLYLAYLTVATLLSN
jgi:Mn2+/Fe2+ NRAMP family transporter